MTDQVTMKALDTMHISNVSAENLNEGDVFTVSETDAKRLEAAGLAERGGSAAKVVNGAPVHDPRTDRDALDAERGEFKAIGVAPQNKMAAAPANKAAPAKLVSAKRKGK